MPGAVVILQQRAAKADNVAGRDSFRPVGWICYVL